MEALKNRYQTAFKALDTFDHGLNRYSKELAKLNLANQDDHEISDMLRDSVIQRFEYCYELTWKFLAAYLTEKEGISLEVISPRSVFRAACKSGLLSSQETETTLEMVESRNKTLHMYKEEIADYLSMLARGYCTLMQTILNRVSV